MIELSVIIVSYNSKDILTKCLEGLRNSDFKGFEVIVVDNASKDGTEEIIKKYSEVNFIRNKENLGFSKANNIGIKKSSGKYILFLNPDAVVDKNTLSSVLSFMKQTKDAGIVTSKVVLPDGTLDDSAHRGTPTPWNAFCYFSGLEKLFPRSKLLGGYHMGWSNYSGVHEIVACAGSFMMVKREVGNKIGWWDEDFFFYGEDLDFCLKVKEKGLKVYYYPLVSTTHYKGVSSGIKKISKQITTADLDTKRWATKHRFLAMRILYNKHYINKYPKIVTWLVFKAIDLKYHLALRTLSK